MKYVIFIVACAFISAGIVNLIGPSVIRAEFGKWGYPSWLRVVVALVELTGALFLLTPATRFIGASILLAVILGVMVSFVRSREWMKMQYPLVLLFLLVVALTRTYPLG